MPADLQRQQIVREGVAHLRQHLDDPNAPDDGVRVETLAEGLALLAAEARLAGVDEGLHAEIVLKSCEFTRETLNEARRVMAALGYVEIAAILKRLERTAPRSLSFKERMQAKARKRGQFGGRADVTEPKTL
ncbi:hypothetical protein RAD15_05025 [Bradyrhizobium sp. 14AA]